jgi:WD40 repeat protein
VLAVAIFVAGASPSDDEPQPTQGKQPSPQVDRLGDPLPYGVVARMASGRMHHNERLRALNVSPDGKLVATGGGNRLRIWEATTGRLLHQFQIKSNWDHELAFSTDSSILTSVDGYHDINCRRFRMADGKELSHFHVDLDGDVDLSRDGSLLVVASEDKKSFVFETATGRKIGEFKIEMDGRPALRPDGKALAVTDAKNKTMRIYEVPTGELLLEFQAELILFSSPVFSPDGRSLAANHGKRGGAIRIWDAETGKVRMQLQDSRYTHTDLCFSNDGKLLAAAGPESPDFGVWDTTTGKQIRLIAPPFPPRVVRFAPDDKTLYTESRDGAVLVWDLETGKKLPLSADPITAVRDLRFDESGKRLYSRADIFRAWDPADGREAATFPPTTAVCALSPDAKLLADSTSDGTIRILDATTGREIRSWRAHDRTLWVLFFSVDRKRLYSTGGWDPRIRVWETATGRLLHEMHGYRDGIMQMAASPDNRFLVSSGNHTADASDLRLWNVDTGREIRRLPARPHMKHYPAFSPDGRWLAAATGRSSPSKRAKEEIRIWETASGELLCTLAAHDAEVTALAFTRDGLILASGSADRTIVLWDLTTGKPRRSLTGHEGTILSLAFTNDGKRLAASSPDAPVFIWDVAASTQREFAKTPVPAAELAAFWENLQNKDPAKALRAVQTLASNPVQAVELVRKHLLPVRPADDERMHKLLADLDSEEFTTRNEANKELRALDDAAGPALRKALEGEPSPEARRRIEELIAKLNAAECSGEPLCAVRAVLLLESLKTPEARDCLSSLASGLKEARLTRAAAASLGRLKE